VFSTRKSIVYGVHNTPGTKDSVGAGVRVPTQGHVHKYVSGKQ